MKNAGKSTLEINQTALCYKVVKWLMASKGIGRIRARSIIETVGDCEKLLYGTYDDLKYLEGDIKFPMRELIHSRKLPELDNNYERNCAVSDGIITFWDEAYPQLLKQIHDPPLLLFYKGHAALLGESSTKIAVVGTRAPTDYGRKYGSEITKILALEGNVIVSGLAMGIDAVAHKAAIETGSQSIGVLGCGINLIYPKQNEKIYKDLLKDGLILSEYEMDSAPHPIHFPERNRIIAGISESCIVVEAAQKSGSLITAEMVLELGRDVYALPGPIFSTKSAGCHELIRNGAEPIISISALKEQFGLKKDDEINNKTCCDEAYTNHPIVSYLQLKGQATFEEILESLALEVSELMLAIDLLENRGVIHSYGFFYHI